jgi:HK97 gp10 family phage protein
MTPAALKATLGALPTVVQAQLRPAFTEAAAMVVAEARRTLAETSGAVADSMAAEATDNGAIVTAGSPVAAFLEYGTVRMTARPFLRPAVDAAAEEVRDMLASRFDEAAAGAIGARR